MEKQKLLWDSHWLYRCAMFCLALLFMVQSGFAQGSTVKGRVTYASDNTGVIAATVMVKGTQKGTMTDAEGNFTLPGVSANSVLTVSYIGFETQELTVQANKNFYQFKLAEDKNLIDEVVVVGYGEMRKKEVTGAVVRVDAESISKLTTSDVGGALQGQISGVNVQTSSGEPGSTANIIIRGVSSVSGGNDPLYVVDGVPYESDPGLSPQEIASIDVLKDAASAAIYGTRGAAGVILITTKAGKEGEMKVSVDLKYGIQKITSGLDLSNSAEYMYVYSASDASGSYDSPSFSWNTLDKNKNSYTYESDLLSIAESDNQPIVNASINLSGGSGGLTYSLVGSYFLQEGAQINSSFERFNFRANSSMKKKKLTVTSNMNAIFSTKTSPGWGIYQEVYRNTPINSPVDVNSSLSNVGDDENENSTTSNIFAKLVEQSDAITKGFNINFSATYNFTKGLSFNSRVSSGYSWVRTTTLKPVFEIYNTSGELVENSNTRSSIKESFAGNTSFSWENMLNYAYKKGNHDFKATAVFSIEEYTYESYYVQRYDLISTELPSLGAATSDPICGVGTGQWGQDRTSVLYGTLGRLLYNYKSRYLFSASARRDGSSRFSEDNRWGVFPSASAGWNISDEPFFKSLRKKVNSLKLRASVGTTGNQNFSDYAFAATVGTEMDYVFSGDSSVSYGSLQEAYANADIQWETTTQYNLGIDASFFRSRLRFTADFYLSKKSDMLFPLAVPPIAGAGTSATVTLNVGDMQNKGMEFALNWREWKKKYNYYVNATFSRNVNTVTSMPGSNKMASIGSVYPINGTSQTVSYLAEGYEAGAFFLMPTDGVINTAAKLEAYQNLRSDAKMGDLMYVDTTDDGVLDDDDRVYCGSGAPEAEIGFNYGFSYKNFDFSMNWYASIGNEVINGSKIIAYQNGISRDLVYMWSPDNLTSSIPVWYGGTGHYNQAGYADYWLEDGSFLRLRNIVLGYSLPKEKLAKLGLTKLRIYVSADNILTFTEYDGYNPDVGGSGLSSRGIDTGTYPITAMYNVGLQLNF
ncbi:MAG: TonB-dependent receptor [Rikenellaceae bacterium]